jgi:hypothetical protein
LPKPFCFLVAKGCYPPSLILDNPEFEKGNVADHDIAVHDLSRAFDCGPRAGLHGFDLDVAHAGSKTFAVFLLSPDVE